MTFNKEKYYVRRCHELSMIAGKAASPNPNVGAVLVENDEIIGEGWHQKYGLEHAEINALKSVKSMSKKRISQSTMYVSLEPCAIHGNTPPCTDAILGEGIKKVIISARDKTVGVDRVSEYILKNKAVELIYGVDQIVGDYIAKPRNIFVTKNRPYIILKWAQSSDGFIGKSGTRTVISNAYTRRYVHQLRSEVDAILVGRKTVEIDDPALTNRYYSGTHPRRVVLGRIKEEDRKKYNAFSDEANTIELDMATRKGTDGKEFLSDCCRHLKDQNIMKLLIEGGAQTLNGFLESGLWDECHVITNKRNINDGVKAPNSPEGAPIQAFKMHNDHIRIFHNV